MEHRTHALPRPWWERAVFAAGIILAPAGVLMLSLMPWIAPADGRERIVYITFAISLLKFPALALAWWLLTRNAERPDRPGVWSEDEVRQIIARIQDESARRRDDPAALRHLAREAWHVADRLEGEAKGEAVALASVLGARGQMIARR